MFTAPVTFQEASRAIAARLPKATAMKYRQIARHWDAALRRRAFFSARVAEASLLSELKSRVEAVVAGRMTASQARDLLFGYFVGQAADPLARLGFAPPRKASGVAELASVPRLRLVLETNARMANECGQYRQWQELKEFYPYARWVCGYAEEHRPEHLARNGKVYAADHPIWTQSPPGGEFNCHCSRELVSAIEAEERRVAPEPLDSPFAPSTLGFDPSDSLEDPPPFGRTVDPQIAEAARARFPGAPPAPTAPEPAPVPDDAIDEAHRAHREEQRQQALENRRNRFRDDILQRARFMGGETSQALADAIAGEYTLETARYGKPPKVHLAPETTSQITPDGRELLLGSDIQATSTPGKLVRALKRRLNFSEAMRKGLEKRRRDDERLEREAALVGPDVKIRYGGFPLQDVLDRANPNFSTGLQEWMNNCQRCVMAAEAIRRGMDVTAKPCYNPLRDPLARDTGWPAVFENTSSANFISVSGRDGNRVKEKIEKQMRSWGPGARAIVRVIWRTTNPRRRSGHVFSVENTRGRIIFYDVQSGSPDCSSYFNSVLCSSTYKPVILRTDNRNFTNSLGQCCSSR